MMSFVSKVGVAELRYLSDTGELVGEARDLFLLQDQLPTEQEPQRAFLRPDPDTKKQVPVSALFSCLFNHKSSV